MQKLLKLSDYLLWFGAIAILIAVPLYPKFPLFRVPGTYVSIRLEDFLMVFVFGALFLSTIPRLKKITLGGTERAIFVFLVVSLVSLISGVFLTQTVPLQLGFLHWLRRLEYFLPFFLGLFLLKLSDKELIRIDLVVKCVAVVLFLVFLYGVGQKYLSWPVIITQNEEYSKGIALRWIPGSHLNSTFAGHYDLATFVVFTLSIIISTLVSLRKSRLWGIFLFVVSLSGLWLIVNSVSRISVVSYIVAVTISLGTLKKFKFIPLVLIGSLIIFSLSGNLLARYGQLFEVFTRKYLKIERLTDYVPPRQVFAQEEIPGLRVESSQTPSPKPVFEDRSSSIRFNVEWPRAIRAFSKNPLLGTGFSSISLATDNDYLRLFGEVGLLGFIGFILILVRISQEFLRGTLNLGKFSSLEAAFVAGTAGGFAGVLISALFIDVFEASKFAIIFWLMIGLCVGLIRKRTNEKNI